MNLAGLSYGMVMGWPAPLQGMMRSSSSPLGAALTEPEWSWVTAIMSLGAMPGALVSGAVADRWGRKAAGYLMGLLLLVSWVGVMAARDFPVLVGARLVAGVGCGSVLTVVPLYVGEVAEQALRGMLGSFLVLFINFGIVLPFAVAPAVPYQALNGLCLAVPLLLVALWALLPETPCWLASRGRAEDAVRAMTWLRGGDPLRARQELEQLSSGAEGGEEGEELSVVGALRDLVRRRCCRRALLTALVLFATQQMSGIFPILNYTVQIMKMSGASLSPTIGALIASLLQLAGSVLACLLVERLGRRALLVGTLLVMALCLAALGAAFHWQGLGVLPLVAMCVYMVMFALGPGPVPYILLSEMFPTSVRSLASSFSITWTFILAFSITKSFGDFAAVFGMDCTFWVFSVCCLLGAVFTLTYVHETKGRPLADILKDLEGDD